MKGSRRALDVSVAEGATSDRLGQVYVGGPEDSQPAMIRLCLILFGPPGSGKGTQAKLLKQSLGVAHISTGDMLREEAASNDGLGKEVAALMQSGGLVPDEMVNQMVADRIEQPGCEKGFILDGYPRTLSQARLWVGVAAEKRLHPVV